MKRPDYKTGLLLIAALLLVPLTLRAAEVTKEYHKEFKADAATTLDLNNRYGNIIIESWDKDQVVIDVKISVTLPDREKAQRLLDYITVDFSDAPNLISAKTMIDNKFNFTGWGGDSRKFSINYTVRMPAVTALALVNRYGDTNIDELKSLVNLDIKYGDLTAGKLTRGNVKPLSTLYLAYGKGVIDKAGWLDLTLRYSGNLTIGESQALLIDSKYSKIDLGETSSVVGESKYDNIKISKINNLVLDNGYCDVSVGELTKKLTYTGSYGSFKVENVPAGFEALDTDTRYMSVKLGIAESANYKLEAKLSYGDLKYNEERFRNLKRIIETRSSIISGTMGDEESPTSMVNINSAYASVRLN